MNIRDYEKLIRIYDKMDGIEEVQKLLFGEAYVTGFEDGLFGIFDDILGILKDNIDEKYKHDEREDFFHREWFRILDDKSLTPLERAQILCAKHEV